MERIHALYSRVSTDMQRDKGLSIPRQKRWLEDGARLHDFKEYQHFIDNGFSAKDTNRPAYQELITLINNNRIESVMVYRLDRIARNLSDLINLINLVKKHDVNLISLMEKFDTKTAIGNAMFMIVGVFAQFEREMVSERVKDVMWDMAKRGRFCGGQLPYGYDLEKKKPVINKTESILVKYMYDNIESGESIRGTTIELNNKGYKTKRGTTWATSTIRRILTNPFYTGYYTYGKRANGSSVYLPQNKWLFKKGGFYPIIKKPQFDRVQKILKGKMCFSKNSNNFYLLSGLTRCECGGAMTGYTMRKPNGKTYSYHKCHNHTSKGPKICEGNSISKEILETYVMAKIKKTEGIDLYTLSDEKRREIILRKVKKVIVRRDKKIIIQLDKTESI